MTLMLEIIALILNERPTCLLLDSFLPLFHVTHMHRFPERNVSIITWIIDFTNKLEPQPSSITAKGNLLSWSQGPSFRPKQRSPSLKWGAHEPQGRPLTNGENNQKEVRRPCWLNVKLFVNRIISGHMTVTVKWPGKEVLPCGFFLP